MWSCHVDIFNICIVKYANFSFMDCGFIILLGRVPPPPDVIHVFSYIFHFEHKILTPSGTWPHDLPDRQLIAPTSFSLLERHATYSIYHLFLCISIYFWTLYYAPKICLLIPELISYCLKCSNMTIYFDIYWYRFPIQFFFQD